MDLALKDTHLVAEHDQLDILVRFATPGRGHKRPNPAQPESTREKATAHDVR
jgi:hypothetical protein